MGLTLKQYRYEPGEKSSRSNLRLQMAGKPNPQDFDALIWGFAPGKSTIDMSDAQARMIFAPLLHAIRQPQLRGGFMSQLRDVYIFGMTDQVGGPGYNDLRLRARRAEAIAKLLRRLLGPVRNPPTIHWHAWRATGPGKYLNDGGTSLRRKRGRSVLIKLKCPPLPARCVPFAGPLGIQQALAVIRTGLSSHPRILNPKERRLILALIKMIQNGGNDEFVTGPLIIKFVEQWVKAHRAENKRLQRLTDAALEKEGRKHGMWAMPRRGSARFMTWLGELTNRILQKTQPAVMQAKMLSLRTEWRDLVRDTCQDLSKILPYLRNWLNNFETGLEIVTKTTRSAQIRQIVKGLGEWSSYIPADKFETIVQQAFRNRVRQLMRVPPSVYSTYSTVYKRP